MDMQLPSVDGITATQLIRGSATGRQVPIVAMTANAYAADQKHCQDSDMHDFIAKTFGPDELVSINLNCLARGAY